MPESPNQPVRPTSLTNAQATTMDRDLDTGLRQSEVDAAEHPHHHERSRLDDPQRDHNIELNGHVRSFASPGHPQLGATFDVSAALDAHHAAAPVKPDDFYRNFGATYETNIDEIAMASSVPRPSLRTNGNGDGTSSRNPTLPANRIPVRLSNQRSVSSPLDSKSTPARVKPISPAGQPSVRDLTKRFDSEAGLSTVTRAPTRPPGVPRVKRDAVATNSNGASYLTLRAGNAHDSPLHQSGTRSQSHSSRSRVFAEDNVSSNPQSFASRIGKPRGLVNGNSISSKSMTNLPPMSPPQLPPSSPPTAPRPPALLFGEVLPEESHATALGHGIEGLRSRRTSESNIRHPKNHNRSFSDADLEPPSPSHWYRDASDHVSPPAQQSGTSKHHARSRSDVATLNSSSFFVQNSDPQPPHHPQINHSTAVSKLPISVRKLNSPPSSTSPSSTRSNSPSLKRPHVHGRTSRAGTPTSKVHTPTHANQARKPAQPKHSASKNNTRLQAYVASPSPKLSPPLRSSRPRQPVSMATTASSRMRAVERGKSPHKPPSRPPTRAGEATSRRRKISVGPIDFEQRREHIRLAYSKSIRESQVLEAQQQAEDRRREEAEAEAEAAAQIDITGEDAVGGGTIGASAPAVLVLDACIPTDGEGAPISSEQQSTETSRDLGKPGLAISLENVSELPDAPAPTPEEIIDNTPTSILTGPPSEDIEQPMLSATIKDFDSPTLGVPGSFPALSPSIDVDEPPMSAISRASDITEFDTEPQTDLPVQAGLSSHESYSLGASQSPHRSEYHYPFEDSPDPGSSTFSETVPSQAEVSTAARITHDDDPLMSGSFMNEAGNGLGLVLGSQRDPEPTITVDQPAQDDLNTLGETSERLPFPRLELRPESDCQSDPEYESYGGREGDDAATDACTEDTEEHNGKFTSRRSSTCDSIDAISADELQSSARKDRSLPGMSDNLPVPSPLSPRARLSHQSTWTDVSVGSGDPSNTATSSRPQSYDYSSHGHATIYGTNLNGRETEHSANEVHYSYSSLRSPNDSTRSSAYLGQPQLPELDTGAGFSIPYLSADDLTSDSAKIPIPQHEPPPVPTPAPSSAAESRRPSSTFYEQSQNGSTLVESGRESNDYVSTTETSQSFPHSLNASKDPYNGESLVMNGDDKSSGQEHDELSTKERHRLTQRRNVIKELVDTEAVFVRDMNIVEEIYKGTAEACPKLDLKTVKLIFRNTDEIIEFHTSFLSQLKEAVAKVYIPKGARSKGSREDSMLSESSQASAPDFSDSKDREVFLGPLFMSNMEKMKLAHEGFLRNSDQAAKRLIQIQQDPTVKVWLNECNEVAKDLTAAWDLDSLLIKPMQRITKYPNLIMTLLQHTPKDHPDREGLNSAKDILENAIIEINQTKKNFELVGQIVGRKRKESDVKAGFARAFGKRVDKLQTSNNRPAEDPIYAKLNEKFGDDYLRLQVVLRDVEFYTRQVTTYVREFLQYLSSIELVMRLQPGSYPELESKWVQFNISVRDLEKVALEEHLAQVRKHVIEPFELVIKAYGNPSLAMKKRQKRRLDYERAEQLRRGGKSVDVKLKELVEQYEALNDTLKKELPQLSSLTERIGNICLSNFVNIQTNWYKIWKEKMRAVLPDCAEMPDLKEVVSTFQRDFPYIQEQVANIGMLSPDYKGRVSQSTASGDESIMRGRPRPSALDTRSRGLSLNVDSAPSLPTPDFARRSSGSFTMSPGIDARGVPSPHQYYYKDYYSGAQSNVASSIPPMSPEVGGSSSRSMAGAGTGAASTRPSTGWSYESGAPTRQSSDLPSQSRRDSNNTAYSSTYAPHESRRFSGLFHSALPLPDGPEESHRSSRASSRERWSTTDGYNVLWLAASLFEFNIATTKHEAGYPYLIYQAGEIFDVIGEKGELWLAKNQDDEAEQVGWIWSKHFAKLADS
ncbi:Rho guanine nucleotide exchange factor gef1 [Paramyrothecium foliicola]|nr:Rho guanine nucleotide exchange factor gef1 [Paramyrothecium foliicola]